jgi:hypothetical protein
VYQTRFGQAKDDLIRANTELQSARTAAATTQTNGSPSRSQEQAMEDEQTINHLQSQVKRLYEMVLNQKNQTTNSDVHAQDNNSQEVGEGNVNVSDGKSGTDSEKKPTQAFLTENEKDESTSPQIVHQLANELKATKDTLAQLVQRVQIAEKQQQKRDQQYEQRQHQQHKPRAEEGDGRSKRVNDWSDESVWLGVSDDRNSNQNRAVRSTTTLDADRQLDGGGAANDQKNEKETRVVSVDEDGGECDDTDLNSFLASQRATLNKVSQSVSKLMDINPMLKTSPQQQQQSRLVFPPGTNTVQKLSSSSPRSSDLQVLDGVASSFKCGPLPSPLFTPHSTTASTLENTQVGGGGGGGRDIFDDDIYRSR